MPTDHIAESVATKEVMTLRLSLLFCLAVLTPSSVNADLIFSLRPVQTTGASTAFVDLVVSSSGTDAFAAFGYGINIVPLGLAPNGGLFFDTPITDEASNADYVFAGNSGLITSFLDGSNQLLQGGDISATTNDIMLNNLDGQRLVARIELGITLGLTTGDAFRISLNQNQFFRGEANDNSMSNTNDGFSAMGSVIFTAGNGGAAVPEPSSIAALLLFVGGVMYRRRKLQS